MLVLILEGNKMKRQYKVLSGKWETLIEAEKREDIFNILVEEMEKVKVRDLPLGVLMGVVEIGSTDGENIIHFLTILVLESACFKVNQLSIKKFENYLMKREGMKNNVHQCKFFV